MNAFDLLLVPLFLGLVGFLTPCALGMNLVFLGFLQGKPKQLRLVQAALFTAVRALMLTALGLLFGYAGQSVVDFQMLYRPVIAVLFIVLGAGFLLSRIFPLPMPRLGYAGKIGKGKPGAAALGAAFGLDIPACSAPLLLYLLGQTILQGDMVFGAISLSVFGFGMSLPLLLIAGLEGANRFLERAAKASGPLAYASGFLLIVLGLAAFFPSVMAAEAGLLTFAAKWLGR